MRNFHSSAQEIWLDDLSCASIDVSCPALDPSRAQNNGLQMSSEAFIVFPRRKYRSQISEIRSKGSRVSFGSLSVAAENFEQQYNLPDIRAKYLFLITNGSCTYSR